MSVLLNSDEVKLVTEASAFLSVLHNKAFNALAALTSDSSMGDPRSALFSLNIACETLREIKQAVAENPYFTEDHIADILAIKELIAQELFDLRDRRMTQSIEALQGGVIDARTIEAIRHAGLSSESIAVSKLGKLFDMVEKKITPPRTQPVR